ncbi:T9SS type A sorting domain-containing protein [Hymenobacter radiodurans]|uniref:T9SS type A sorting domain-containing protein n=1 Tax=Hymenobacter radiodurans TaxID=2496028 RepID=UPI001404EC55|nr:T9SS type A sorting domain-containing protein [Hymenobacter radiodurans]
MNRYLKRFEPPRVALALLLVCGAAAPHTSEAQTLYNGLGGIFAVTDSMRYVRGDVENAGELNLTSVPGGSATRLFIDEGNLINTGTGTWVAGQSTVLLLGVGTTSHTLSMNGASLYNVRLDNPAGTSLGSNATVTSALKLANGNLLTTEAFSLTLGPNGAVFGPAAGNQEDGTHYVKGSLLQQKAVTGTNDVNFGNMGFTLNPQGQSLTLAVDRRTGLKQQNYSYGRSRNFAGRESIDRIWRLSTPGAKDPAKPVNISLAWLADNDNDQNFDTALAQVWRSTNQGATWVREGVPQKGKSRQVTVATTHLNAWYTVSSTKAPMLTPEQLIFSAAPRQLDAVLSWSTTSKPENGWFVIDRSKDGQQWQEISRQPVAGQSWSPAASTAVDKGAGSLGQIVHYRLRQLGTDGMMRSSSTLQVRFDAPLAFNLDAYPVPMQDYLTLDLRTPTEGSMYLQLYDSNGRLVINRQEKAPAGSSRYQLQVRDLPLGMYTLRIRQGSNTVTRTIPRY